MHPPRPLTHDLFTKFIVSTNYKLVSVIIYQIVDGVFFSNINFKNSETEEELILDARTSDAVAMAVRFDAPIYTTQQVLNEAGILLELEEVAKEEETFSETVNPEDSLTSVSMEELQKLLDEAVKEEDFDTALEIQEEIKRRKKKID
nr:bifunctional nuclease family protein [Chryseobacterium indoltheticum]